MTEKWKEEAWAQDFWYSGKTTRRTVVGWGVKAAALGATMLVPAPWQAAFGQAKPYKIGSEQPLSGAAALGGIPRFSRRAHRAAAQRRCSGQACPRTGA